MADYETLFPGRFLKSADLAARDATVTIKAVVGEEIDGKDKVVISFEGTKKQWVCNRTGAEALKLMFGRETNGWLGKKVTLYRMMMKDPFGGDDAPEIGAIRVRGSPEIDKPMSADVKRGRKTLKISVRPTGKPPAAAAKPNGTANGNGQHAATTQTPAPSEPSPEDLAEIARREAEQSGDPF